MLSVRRLRPAFGVFRVALCCLLTICGATWCAAKPVSVSGKVVDSQGKPVAGVKVRLAVMAVEPSFTVIREVSQTSRKSGEYTVGPVEADELDFLVVGVYEPGKWIGCSFRVALAQADPLEIVVSKPAVATGVVVDENGAPMPGVEVGYGSLQSRGGSTQDSLSAEMLGWLHPLKTMVTGADGGYELSDIPSHMIATPSLSKDGWTPMMKSLGTDEGNKRIVMVPAGSVTGRVIGPDGRPFPRVMVFAHDARDSWARCEYAGNDGVFRIDGVPSGSCSIVCGTEGPGGATREGVGVKAGALTDLGDIALPAPVELSGRVLDAATGKPIKGAKILIHGKGIRDVETVSGANGEYKLAIDSAQIYLEYEGGAPLYPESFFGSVEITVPAEGLHGYDIRLTKAEQARGRVLNTSGKPVAGVAVSIVTESDDFRAVTDSSGRFTVFVPSEDPDTKSDEPIILQAREKKPNGQGRFTYIKREKLLKNGVTITLAPAKSVRVRVVDTAGKPIAGAKVSLEDWRAGGTVGTRRTDKSGRATFAGVFTGGRYGFTASCIGYDEFSDSGEEVDSGSSKWAPTRRIVMCKADPVRGTVVDSDGRPVVGATVTQVRFGRKKMAAATGSGGVFKLFLGPKSEGNSISYFDDDPDSVAGRIKLMAEDKTHSRGVYLSVGREAAIAKGVKFVLKPVHEMQVIVRDTSGKPVSGATVTNSRWMEDYMPARERESVSSTDAEGITRLSLYEGMSTMVTASMEGYVYIGELRDTPAAGSREWTGKYEIVLTPLTRTVEGKIVDGAGKPIKGAYVDMAMSDGVSATTDAEGRFKMDLPDTTVSLMVFTGKAEAKVSVGPNEKTVTITVNDH